MLWLWLGTVSRIRVRMMVSIRVVVKIRVRIADNLISVAYWNQSVACQIGHDVYRHLVVSIEQIRMEV